MTKGPRNRRLDTLKKREDAVEGEKTCRRTTKRRLWAQIAVANSRCRHREEVNGVSISPTFEITIQDTAATKVDDNVDARWLREPTEQKVDDRPQAYVEQDLVEGPVVVTAATTATSFFVDAGFHHLRLRV